MVAMPLYKENKVLEEALDNNSNKGDEVRWFIEFKHNKQTIRLTFTEII